MAGLCAVTAVASLIVLLAPADRFTLAWTHSTEHTQWEEDWRIGIGVLTLVAARVEGSGPGVDPPAGAVREGRWWRWTPTVPPRAEIVLANSAVVAPHRLCHAREGAGSGLACVTLDSLLPPRDRGKPVTLRPCPEG